MADNFSLAERLADVFKFRHQLAGFVTTRQPKINFAELLTTRRACRTQSFQALDAPHRASSPCFHAFAYPDFLLRQQFIGARIGQRFFVQLKFLALLIGEKTAWVTTQFAPIQFHYPRRYRIKESSIVSDHHRCASMAFEQFFQPHNAVNVQMISRLIEQEQIRRGDQCLRERDTFFIAARERRDFHFAIQIEPRQHLFDALRQSPTVTGFELLLQIVQRLHVGIK